MIGDRVYYHSKLIDEVLSNLRAYLIALKLKEGATVESLMEKDDAREAILPFMKKQMLFANCDGPFGYPVIDGSGINENFIKIYKAEPGEQVVLASDGYPKLFDTLKETESYLFSALEKDPDCIGILRSTKGLKKGNESFDDRSYISFKVK
jgi:glycerophosphoryl diester phosphodiesterase